MAVGDGSIGLVSTGPTLSRLTVSIDQPVQFIRTLMLHCHLSNPTNQNVLVMGLTHEYSSTLIANMM